MDNASNALIIAGGILIALVILSLGVYLVASYSQVGDAYSNNLEAKELEAYNNKFEAFRGRSDITPQEIYSLYTYCEQYKESNGVDAQINIGGAINDLDSLISKMQEKNASIVYGGKTVKYSAYQCTDIHYNPDTGRIDGITFASVQYTKNYGEN